MSSVTAALPQRPQPAPGQPRLVAAGRSTQRKAAIMRWLRRAHLYSGLLLLPWVLIYGISGFLFNHGGSSSTSRIVPVAAADRVGLAPDSDEMGTRLMAALHQDVDNHETILTGSWSFDFKDPATNKNYRLSLPTDGSDGTLTESRTRGSRTTLRYPGDTYEPEHAAAEQVAQATLATLGITPNDLRVVGGPSLRVIANDLRWSATLTRDRATKSSVDTFDFGRLMRRLHVTHGYGRPDWSRIAWAVIVDIMSFAMVLWAISGVVMWWQKRSLRKSGAITVTAAFNGGVILILALQAIFTR